MLELLEKCELGMRSWMLFYRDSLCEAYPDQLAECKYNVKPYVESFREWSMCEIEQNYFSPDKNRRLFLQCNFKESHNSTKLSKLKQHTKTKHWVYPEKTHLLKTKKHPQGGISQSRISKIIIIIHQYAWLNPTPKATIHTFVTDANQESQDIQHYQEPNCVCSLRLAS